MRNHFTPPDVLSFMVKNAWFHVVLLIALRPIVPLTTQSHYGQNLSPDIHHKISDHALITFELDVIGATTYSKKITFLSY